jgi:hypothetical protein
MTIKANVPEQITAAVNAILSPYGVTIESLNQPKLQADDQRYFPIETAEKYCGVSKWTLSRAVKSGKLPQIKLSSTQQGKVLFDRLDLDKWLKTLKSKPNSLGVK